MHSCLGTQVNAASPPEAVRGTVLLNSAGAMNNKGVIGDWRIVAVYPLLLFIDFLLSIPAVSAGLFNKVRCGAPGPVGSWVAGPSLTNPTLAWWPVIGDRRHRRPGPPVRKMSFSDYVYRLRAWSIAVA
jgi:hypothetical protein